MAHHAFTEIAVYLATASGVQFSGLALGVALATNAGTIDVTAHGESFLELRGTTQLTVRTSDGVRIFELLDANGSIKAARLSVLAHSIHEISARNQPAPATTQNS